MPKPVLTDEMCRMTLGFFCLSALDLLGVLDKVKGDERDDIIEWVYEQQLRASYGPLVCASDSH